MVLLTDDATDCAIFVAETEKSAFVALREKCCTVAGEQWLNNYMKILSDTLLNEVEIFDSHAPFKFGDGHRVYAERRARIPAQIGDKQFMIDVEIVKENIALLLSKSSLKKAGTILNMQLDKAVMFDQDIQLHLSTSGHCAVEILPKSLMNLNECENVLMFDINTNQEKEDQVHGQNTQAIWT